MASLGPNLALPLSLTIKEKLDLGFPLIEINGKMQVQIVESSMSKYIGRSL